MKKSTKIILIVAASLVAAGIIVAGVSFAFGKSFQGNLFNVKGEKKTYTFDASTIKSVDIDIDYSDIELKTCDGDTATVITTETEKFGFDVTVERGVLKVERRGVYQWFDFLSFGFIFDRKMTVSIPDDICATLSNISVNSGAGSVTVPDIKTQAAVDIAVSAGEIEITGSEFTSDLNVASASGEIEISNCKLMGVLNCAVTSGSTSLKRTTVGKNVNISGVTGEISFKAVTVNGDVNITTTTGAIELDGISAHNYDLATTTGDIDVDIGGTNKYVFDVSVVTGDSNYPQSQIGAQYEFSAIATTGSIEIEYED